MYIVKSLEEFLSVGETKTAIVKRFQLGFQSYRHFKRTGKTRVGYKRYKWIELIDPAKGDLKKLKVWVVLFPSDYEPASVLLARIKAEKKK